MYYFCHQLVLKNKSKYFSNGDNRHKKQAYDSPSPTLLPPEAR